MTYLHWLEFDISKQLSWVNLLKSLIMIWIVANEDFKNTTLCNLMLCQASKHWTKISGMQKSPLTLGNGVAQWGTCVSEWRVQGRIQIQNIHWKRVCFYLQAPSFTSNVMYNSLDSTNNIIRNIKSPDILGVYDLCNYTTYEH